MNRFGSLLLLLTAGLSPATAQNISVFDVASVKASPPGGRFDCHPILAGRFTCHNAPLDYLILRSLADQPFTPPGRVPKFKNAPDWIGELYDIDAVANKAGEMTESQAAAPISAFLRERFGLAAHLEIVEQSGYLLEQQTSGAKLKKSAADTAYSVKRTSEGVVYTAASVQILAALAGNRNDVSAPVVDHTGLEGAYDFTYRYDFSATPTSPDAEKSATADAGNSTRDALAALGLRLVPSKVKLSVVVIDQIHRPTAN